jgi:hypothetical protein
LMEKDLCSVRHQYFCRVEWLAESFQWRNTIFRVICIKSKSVERKATAKTSWWLWFKWCTQCESNTAVSFTTPMPFKDNPIMSENRAKSMYNYYSGQIHWLEKLKPSVIIIILFKLQMGFYPVAVILQ